MTTAEPSENYCQHPECHNSRFAYYSDLWATGSVQAWPQRPSGREIWLADPGIPSARRWCKSHALIYEGVAFG